MATPVPDAGQRPDAPADPSARPDSGGRPAELIAVPSDELSPANVREIDPYVPGKPIEELARELHLGGPAGIVKVASNENPLGPSPRALQAIREAAEEVNRYPDSTCHALTEALGAKLRVDPREILFGNGSNEIIEIAVRTFCTQSDEAVLSQYAFGMAKIALQAHGVPMRVVPARGYGCDLEAMAEAITPRTKLIYLDNPNNPTGTYFGRAAFERFLARVPPRPVIMLDEAYLEFVQALDYPNGLDYFRSHPRLMLVRTFSKAHGLAGLRIGYAIAPAPMIDLMHRVREPFNVSLIAQRAALAALGDEEHIARSRQRVVEGLAYLWAELTRLGLEVEPSQGNFVLCDVKRPARQVYEALLVRGVITRPLGPYGLHTHLRINVGLPEEDRRVIEALEQVLRP